MALDNTNADTRTSARFALKMSANWKQMENNTMANSNAPKLVFALVTRSLPNYIDNCR